MNTPPHRRSKPRLRAAIAAVFAVAILVAAVGQAGAAPSPHPGKVKPPVEVMKVSW
jgi:hypothetical protein